MPRSTAGRSGDHRDARAGAAGRAYARVDPGRWSGPRGCPVRGPRIRRAFGPKPHIIGTWKLSTDLQFVEKVSDVVGFYMARPKTPWSCTRTKSPRSRLIRGHIECLLCQEACTLAFPPAECGRRLAATCSCSRFFCPRCNSCSEAVPQPLRPGLAYVELRTDRAN